MRTIFATFAFLVIFAVPPVAMAAQGVIPCNGFPVDPLTTTAVESVFAGDFVELRDGFCSVGRCAGTGTQVFLGSSASAIATGSQDLDRLRLALKRLLSEKSDLASAIVRPTGRGTVIEYPQLVGDEIVRGASIVLNLDGVGRVVGVVNSITLQPDELPRAPKLDANEVERRVEAIEVYQRQTVGYDSLGSAPTVSVRSEPFLFSGPNGIEWAYEVRVQAAEIRGPACVGSPVVPTDYVVSGNDASALRVKERSHGCRPSVGIFDPIPLRMTCPEPNGKIPPVNSGDYVRVELERLTERAEGGFVLKGPYVQVQDLRPPFHDEIVVRPTGNACEVEIESGSVAFAAVMAYYHLDQKQAYVHRLGIHEAVDSPLIVDVSAGCRKDARYENDPAGAGPLWFGEHWPFMAEDALVVIHEHGHSVQAAQAVEQYDACAEPQGMSEGFADYWTFSHFAEKLNASCSLCYGPWINDSHCVRRLDRTQAGLALSNDRYRNGMIWANALFDVCDAISGDSMLTPRGKREVCDLLVLYSHYAIGRMGRPPSMYTAAAAVLTADLTLNRGVNLPQICRAFAENKMLQDADCQAVDSLNVLIPAATRRRPARHH